MRNFTHLEALNLLIEYKPIRKVYTIPGFTVVEFTDKSKLKTAVSYFEYEGVHVGQQVKIQSNKPLYWDEGIVTLLDQLQLEKDSIGMMSKLSSMYIDEFKHNHRSFDVTNFPMFNDEDTLSDVYIKPTEDTLSKDNMMDNQVNVFEAFVTKKKEDKDNDK